MRINTLVLPLMYYVSDLRNQVSEVDSVTENQKKSFNAVDFFTGIHMKEEQERESEHNKEIYAITTRYNNGLNQGTGAHNSQQVEQVRSDDVSYGNVVVLFQGSNQRSSQLGHAGAASYNG